MDGGGKRRTLNFEQAIVQYETKVTLRSCQKRHHHCWKGRHGNMSYERFNYSPSSYVYTLLGPWLCFSQIRLPYIRRDVSFLHLRYSSMLSSPIEDVQCPMTTGRPNDNDVHREQPPKFLGSNFQRMTFSNIPFETIILCLKLNKTMKYPIFRTVYNLVHYTRQFFFLHKLYEVLILSLRVFSPHSLWNTQFISRFSSVYQIWTNVCSQIEIGYLRMLA